MRYREEFHIGPAACGAFPGHHTERLELAMTDAFDSKRADILFSRNHETVLVVEEDPDLREITLQRIEGLGYVVVEAADGAEAVSRLIREPDIVLSAAIMGGSMTGYDLRLWIREHKPHTKVVLTSDSAGDPAGEFLLLRQPFSREELGRALSTTLYRAEGD
jgi:CheY-like chemotaxis protein